MTIGINFQNGLLKKYGFYKLKYGTKVATHPDSKIIFGQTEAPRYKEAVEIALKAAQCLYGIRAIGWDIAITADGPIIIEGNDNWEISLNQACDRPLRKEWEMAIN